MEDVCSKVVKRMLNAHVAAALETWRDHSRKQKRGEGICARVLAHWQHRTSAAAFECW